MATLYSPKIAMDGLTLALDVSNPKSYPGSGTTWKDLAQGIIFTSAGTTTPVEVINNAKSFAFNSSGYWYCSTQDASRVDMGGDCTLILWLYCEDISVRRTVFEKSGTIYNSFRQEIAVTWEPDENISYYSRESPTYDYGYMGATTIGAWNMMALKMSTGKTAAPRVGYRSKNGSPWLQDYYSQSNTALVPAGSIVIGNGYADVCDVGNVGAVLVYNRMLTDDDIAKNYSAMKGRFGL